MRKGLFMAVLAAIGSVGLATAAPYGVLDIAGVGNVRISASDIDFAPFGQLYGNFIVTNGTGAFSVLGLLDPGKIQDLNIAVAPPGGPLATPVDPFLEAPSPSVIFSFNLGRILMGGGPSCVPAPSPGNSCTPTEIVANSPFILTQSGNNVSVTVSVLGTVTDTRDDSTAPYAGLFTMNLSGTTVPAVLSTFGPEGVGFGDSSSWSGQFSVTAEPGTFSAIPEPKTLLAIIGAILLLGGQRVAARIRR
jgi:hypothetical protein